MRPFRRFATLAALLAGLTGAPAARAAGTLYTPLVLAWETDNSTVYCTIRNVGSSSMTVTISALGWDDVLFPGPTVALESMEATSFTAGPDATQCKFAVSGSTRNVRAAAIYRDPLTDRYLQALIAR